MKQKINNAVKATGKTINEEFLFKEMAKAFNNGISKCTYVKSVHQNYVTYDSTLKCGKKRIEIGDLLFITFDKATSELRICFLQAKYRRSSHSKFLNFKGNLFQWELLKDKPNVKSKVYPIDILNFQYDYKSLTAYGIFYVDNICGEIDFLYTLPEFIQPTTSYTIPISNASRVFHFKCPKGVGSPNEYCVQGRVLEEHHKETISTCSIDAFEREVLACKIGAPVYGHIRLSIMKLLKSMEGSADDSKVISGLLNTLNEIAFADRLNSKAEESDEGTINMQYNPAAIVVITEAEKRKIY